MKGAYCLLIQLKRDVILRVGSLGKRRFGAGTYVYVGSALGGVEARVARHRSRCKRKRWHIDYLLGLGKVVSVIAIPGARKDLECATVRALVGCEGASVPAKGFGSSDCNCEAHLVYFASADLEWVAESVARAVAMLPSIYPKSAGDTTPVEVRRG